MPTASIQHVTLGWEEGGETAESFMVFLANVPGEDNEVAVEIFSDGDIQVWADATLRSQFNVRDVR